MACLRRVSCDSYGRWEHSHVQCHRSAPDCQTSYSQDPVICIATTARPQEVLLRMVGEGANIVLRQRKCALDMVSMMSIFGSCDAEISLLVKQTTAPAKGTPYRMYPVDMQHELARCRGWDSSSRQLFYGHVNVKKYRACLPGCVLSHWQNCKNEIRASPFYALCAACFSPSNAPFGGSGARLVQKLSPAGQKGFPPGTGLARGGRRG